MPRSEGPADVEMDSDEDYEEELGARRAEINVHHLMLKVKEGRERAEKMLRDIDEAEGLAADLAVRPGKGKGKDKEMEPEKEPEIEPEMEPEMEPAQGRAKGKAKEPTQGKVKEPVKEPAKGKGKGKGRGKGREKGQTTLPFRAKDEL